MPDDAWPSAADPRMCQKAVWKNIARRSLSKGRASADLAFPSMPSPCEIDGVAPTFIYGSNAADQGQWWAKWN
jgi:hypothetical protein